MNESITFVKAPRTNEVTGEAMGGGLYVSQSVKRGDPFYY